MSIMPTKIKHLCARQAHSLSNIRNSYTNYTSYASSQIHNYRYIINRIFQSWMWNRFLVLQYSDDRRINVCLGLAQHITTIFSSSGNAECLKRCTQYYPNGFYAVCIPYQTWCSFIRRLPGKSLTHSFILFIVAPPPNPLLASNSARNIKFQMIQIWSFQHLCTKLWRLLTVNTNAVKPQYGDDDMLQTTCCDRISCCQEKNLQHLGNTYRSSTFKRNTAGCWAKRVQLPKSEIRAPWYVSMALPITDVSPEVLLSADATICKDQHITANNQSAIFHAFNKVLVTSSMTSDMRRCVLDGYLIDSELKEIKK
jgi:hypothetical protein